MSRKDPAFKLFGHQIPFPECQIPFTSSQIPDDCSSLKKSEVGRPCAENSEQLENSSDLGDSNNDSQHNVQKNEPKVNPTSMEDKMKTSSTDEDKMLKKPEKIQQCPRCNSMDTKFCYFNNYNVNQPRHFCKNCQRYWTAGGTMRNVPVGAGRRRNKQLSSQYHRHIIVSSEGIPIPTTKLETSDSSSHQLFSTLESSAAFRSSPPDSSTVLKFGPDAPLFESAGSILNLGNGEEPSLCGSSVTNTSNAQGNESSELIMQRDRGVSNELKTSNGVQCYPVAPWVFPVQWYPGNGMCPPNIPVQFVAGPCWSGTLWAAGGTGTVSIGSNGCLSSSSSTSNSYCSGNGSPPILGKHR